MIPDRFKVRVWNKRHKMMRHGAQGETARGIGVGAYIVAVDYAWSLHVADDEIPMQCTGIRDSGGVLVYEGDVVEVRDILFPLICVITWSDALGTWISPDIDKHYNYVWNCDAIKCHGVVIGNIHENPELMAAS